MWANMKHYGLKGFWVFFFTSLLKLRARGKSDSVPLLHEWARVQAHNRPADLLKVIVT